MIEEAKKLGWTDCGVLSGNGEIRKGSVAGKGYKACYTKKPEVARKNGADILALDFEELVFDLVIARSNEFVEFDLHSIIFGKSRLKALRNFQKALAICKKQKNKILVSTRALDKYQLRGMKDIESFLRTMGMSQEEISAIHKNCEELLKGL